MLYLLCKHQVEDYEKWRRVFDSHLEAQHETGLRIQHVLRDVTDPNLVVLFFEVDDESKARAFMEAPAASEAADISGVVGVPEVQFLSE